jgi:peptide subunit release factor 1 (eRF1)
MAGAVGAIIVREDGKNVHWKKKCEGCSYVEAGTHVSMKPGPGSILTAGYFNCPKCGHQSEVCVYG